MRNSMKAMPEQRERRHSKMFKNQFAKLALGAALMSLTAFAQEARGTGATPAAGEKAGATQGTFTTSDAIPWKPVDPKHPGLQMFAVWGNPNEGASEILQKFPAGMDSGWHWHTAAYQGIVIQGKFTHTFQLASRQTHGPGVQWWLPARHVPYDKCRDG